MQLLKLIAEEHDLAVMRRKTHELVEGKLTLPAAPGEVGMTTPVGLRCVHCCLGALS